MLSQCVSFGGQSISNGYKSINLTNNVDAKQNVSILNCCEARNRTQTNLTIKKFDFQKKGYNKVKLQVTETEMVSA